MAEEKTTASELFTGGSEVKIPAIDISQRELWIKDFVNSVLDPTSDLLNAVDLGLKEAQTPALQNRAFELLRDKTKEVLAEAALAHERISKDQQEIEQLKTETRAMLTQLRAA